MNDPRGPRCDALAPEVRAAARAGALRVLEHLADKEPDPVRRAELRQLHEIASGAPDHPDAPRA